MPWVPERLPNGKIFWNRVSIIEVQCPYCGHEWIYTGNSKHYATCPGRPVWEREGRVLKGERPGERSLYPRWNVTRGAGS